MRRPGETNTEHGGRGYYVKDATGRGVELITRPDLQGLAPAGRSAVHAFTVPLHYIIFRPYIVYRSRDRQLGSTPVRRGWSPVGSTDRECDRR